MAAPATVPIEGRGSPASDLRRFSALAKHYCAAVVSWWGSSAAAITMLWRSGLHILHSSDETLDWLWLPADAVLSAAPKNHLPHGNRYPWARPPTRKSSSSARDR